MIQRPLTAHIPSDRRRAAPPSGLWPWLSCTMPSQISQCRCKAGGAESSAERSWWDSSHVGAGEGVHGGGDEEKKGYILRGSDMLRATWSCLRLWPAARRAARKRFLGVDHVKANPISLPSPQTLPGSSQAMQAMYAFYLLGVLQKGSDINTQARPRSVTPGRLEGRLPICRCALALTSQILAYL